MLHSSKIQCDESFNHLVIKISFCTLKFAGEQMKISSHLLYIPHNSIRHTDYKINDALSIFWFHTFKVNEHGFSFKRASAMRSASEYTLGSIT